MSEREVDFLGQVRLICRKDPRFKLEAYLFVYEALGYTVKVVCEGQQRHVNGRELLEGIRQYAIDRFGPLVLSVFHHWGVRRSEDFGDIVFNLVEHELMGKTDEDDRADFSDWHDFEDVFGRDLKIHVDADALTRDPRRPKLPAWQWKL